MIVIEGPDRVGKTTLADALVRRLDGWTKVHFGVPPDGIPVLDYHMKGLVAAGPRVVVDRLHWSEYAYGMTYRGRCGYSPTEWVALETYLASCRATMVLMTDSFSQIQSRWGGEPFDKGKLSELINRFNELWLGRGALRSIFEFRCRSLNLRDVFDSTGTPRGNWLKTLVEEEESR